METAYGFWPLAFGSYPYRVGTMAVISNQKSKLQSKVNCMLKKSKLLISSLNILEIFMEVK